MIKFLSQPLASAGDQGDLSEYLVQEQIWLWNKASFVMAAFACTSVKLFLLALDVISSAKRQKWIK